MSNKFMTAAAIAALGLVPARAQSVADLLEKGIYAQQAAGDLDSAIQLFRQAVNAAAPSRTLAAQALFHMGSAQAAKGDLAGAAQTFRELLDQYPEQRDLAGRLQQYLPAYRQSSAQAGFTATVYHDPGTSGVSFVLPPGWTATQEAVDTTKKGANIILYDPAAGEPGMGIWVRTHKTDPATLERDIMNSPDAKEAQMHKDYGRKDFVIRRETVRRVQVGSNRGLTAIGDYTVDGANGRTMAVTNNGQSLTIAQQGTLLDNSGRVISAPSGTVKRAEIFTWLWGANGRVAAWAHNVDPDKLAATQALFDSIVNTIVIP